MNNLIKQLECTSVKETQVKLLQEIGKELLTDYVIKVGDVMVKPLWVEAYISMLAPDSQMLLFTEMNVRVSMEFFIFIIIRMISVVA